MKIKLKIMLLVLTGALFFPGTALADPAQEYYKRASAFYHQNEFRQAIADYTRAIELKPDYAEAYYNRSRAYYEDSQYDKAWQDVHKAQELGYDFTSDYYLKTLKKETGREK